MNDISDPYRSPAEQQESEFEWKCILTEIRSCFANNGRVEIIRETFRRKGEPRYDNDYGRYESKIEYKVSMQLSPNIEKTFIMTEPELKFFLKMAAELKPVRALMKEYIE